MNAATETIETLLHGAADHHRLTGRPLVTLSYAQSLDGSLSARRGESLVLSGPASFRFVHALRAAHDAILVGIGTVLSDDPRLTVRLVNGDHPQPVVLDSHLRLPLTARLLGGTTQQPWVAAVAPADPTRKARLLAAGAQVWELPADACGRVDLAALLQKLGAAGVQRLMVEGGAAVLSAFLAARLADRLALTLAPVYVGGQRAVEQPLFNPADPHPVSSLRLPRLERAVYLPLPPDLVIAGSLCWSG